MSASLSLALWSVSPPLDRVQMPPRFEHAAARQSIQPHAESCSA
jgi:hypothetical protein